jgi:hypothetical protein
MQKANSIQPVLSMTMTTRPVSFYHLSAWLPKHECGCTVRKSMGAWTNAKPGAMWEDDAG